ncbi:MAG: DEAD/DEAH box helicase family protein [Nitrososphaerota archaeon]
MDLKLTIFGWKIPLNQVKKVLSDDELNKQLVFTSTIKINNNHKINKTLTLYKMSKKNIYIPRFYPYQKIFTIGSIERLIPKGDSIKTEPNNLKLTKDQELVYNYLLSNVYQEEYADKGNASCTLIMDTGMGKTFIAGALIAKFAVKTLIIIPNTNIIEGWMKMLSNFPFITKVNEDADVVIMIINSAINEEINGIHYSQYFKKFGFVIFDEIHNYPTKERSNIFWRTNFRYALGLTATFKRFDHMENFIHFHLGKTIKASEIPGYQPDIIKWKGMVREIHYYGPPEYTKYISGYMGVNVFKTINMIENDPYRISLIVKLTEELPSDGILIFGENRNFLQKLSNLISESALLLGGANDTEQLAARMARVVLTTYSYGMEGVSISHLDSIILATPRKSKIKQILGRILRRDGDISKIRNIIDIVDMKVRLSHQNKKRRIEYKEKEFDIIIQEVKYQNLQKMNFNFKFDQ